MNTRYYQPITRVCNAFRDETINQSQFWVYSFVPVVLCFTHFMYFIHKRGPNPQAIPGHFIHNSSLHQSTHTKSALALSLYILTLTTTLMQIKKLRGTLANFQGCFYKLEGSGMNGEIGSREYQFTMGKLKGMNVLNILAAVIWARCVVECFSCLMKSYRSKRIEREEEKKTRLATGSKIEKAE